MAALQLRTLIGKPQVDRVFRDVVALIEARWPNRVRGYYLVGSYAVGEAFAALRADCRALRYNDFLLADLQSDNPAFQLAAARRLGQVRYPDPAVTQTLQQLAQAPSHELRAAIAAALAHYQI